MPGHWRLQRISRSIARNHVIFPRHEGEVSAFYDFSGRSSPAAMRDFQRDRKTDGGDPYRPFDIATRAIQLMFPGTKEDTSSCRRSSIRTCPGPWSGAFAFGPEDYRF